MIQEHIKNEMKSAMREKNQAKLNALRSLLAAFTNELVAEKKTPGSPVSDELALRVIKRAIKSRKDSIAQFGAAGRQDLVENEEAELAYIESFAPASVPAEEIKKAAEAKKAELGISDKSKTGILVGAVMGELGGHADGAEVKKIVESLF